MEYVTLNNGVQMPMVGFGVFEIPAEQTAECVFNAYDKDYAADLSWHTVMESIRNLYKLAQR